MLTSLNAGVTETFHQPSTQNALVLVYYSFLKSSETLCFVSPLSSFIKNSRDKTQYWVINPEVSQSTKTHCCKLRNVAPSWIAGKDGNTVSIFLLFKENMFFPLSVALYRVSSGKHESVRTLGMTPSLAQILKDVDSFINKGDEPPEVIQILMKGG